MKRGEEAWVGEGDREPNTCLIAHTAHSTHPSDTKVSVRARRWRRRARTRKERGRPAAALPRRRFVERTFRAQQRCRPRSYGVERERGGDRQCVLPLSVCASGWPPVCVEAVRPAALRRRRHALQACEGGRGEQWGEPRARLGEVTLRARVAGVVVADPGVQC